MRANTLVEINVMESFAKIKVELKFNAEEGNFIHYCMLIYSFLIGNFQFLTKAFHSFIKYGGGTKRC